MSVLFHCHELLYRNFFLFPSTFIFISQWCVRSDTVDSSLTDPYRTEARSDTEKVGITGIAFKHGTPKAKKLHENG